MSWWKQCIACLAIAAANAQQSPAPPQPALAKDPGPFLPPAEAAPARGPRQVAGPTPHLSDGRPDFGGNGAWYPGFNGNVAETTWKGVKSADKHVDVPFLPWTLATFNQRVENAFEGRSRSQVPARRRAALHVRPVSVPDRPDPQPGRCSSLKETTTCGGSSISTPQGAHPQNLKPTWLGDAVGHYDGDTLVVDVTGFNGLAWLDQAGHATTDKLHLTERYTRTDSLTLKYEVTIDDPGAYSQPWTATNTVRWRTGMELMESICQENEKSSVHMIGTPDSKKQ